MTVCIGMTIHRSMRTGQKRRLGVWTWKLRPYLWLGGSNGMKTASILNVVAACKGNVAENIGRYADGEALTAQGEEHEILTAFEGTDGKAENKTI